MRIYLNSSKRVVGQQTTDRQIVKADIVKENPKTFAVRLPDGHIIMRRKARDVVWQEERLNIFKRVLRWFKNLLRRLEKKITPRPLMSKE